MMKFFSNKWTKRVISLLSLVYCAFVGFFAYFSIYYNMVVTQPQQATTMVTAVSVIMLIIMLYTREQFFTKLSSIFLLPAMVLPILMYFGQWNILVPPLVVALVIFFFSGMGETGKTVWGTLILLIYLVASLIYFVVTSMFAPSTVTTTILSGNSPSGLYRCTVNETVDSSNGSTKVTIEPNAMDRDFTLVLFQIKGLERDVMIERPMQPNVTIEWKTEKRADISKDLKKISNNIEVTLSEKQMAILGRDAYKVTFSDGSEQTMSGEAYHGVIIPLTAEMRKELETDATELALDGMGPNTKNICGVSVEDLRTIRLSSLTDEELARLGVPEEGDVLYYNGKVVFRYYIAILEEYFALDKRELGLW
ncbi:MAG TPA: hypothetical protein DCO72_10475 [Ruminococcus sp.]|nr:hypothetical protein [Ruminococcus sp.]